MSDTPTGDVTNITIRFEGDGHEAAAQAFMIQFSDGGMAEDIEERLALQDITVADTDFDIDQNLLIIQI
ncbi:hypothetical protein [Pseudooctadecabacter jejudonensis]|uniref:Uncharacterized protein n=1 Tax=Pseudooctadecabacter jejudonensis TaxID=1391910 RepID=A0A1Y5RWN9_9RHOB|nr:hypothetical protein [Pseudooctadecabacter jejudonensis]SLN26922.1 hypothetical protein PSJ8397_01099 [Pseudooctadecabacter jejudonensis]